MREEEIKVFKQDSFEIKTKKGEVATIPSNTHLIAPGVSIKSGKKGKIVITGGATLTINVGKMVIKADNVENNE